VPNTNIKVASEQANLTPKEREKVDALSKLLDQHQTLSNLPKKQAEQKYNQLPVGQQQDLNAMFGGTEPEDKPRNLLGNVWHYTGGKAVGAGKAALGTLQEIADFTSRLYRTAAVGKALEEAEPGNQYKGLSGLKAAWDTAADNGENVFDPSRISKAKDKYTADRVTVAIKAAQGMPLSEIATNGTDAEKAIAAAAVKGQDKFWQDTLDAVQAAKYSPGRMAGNAVLPESLEGSGFLYKGISGGVDAGFRWYTDPFLILGKAKKAYDAANYALTKIIGNPKKLDEAFTNPKIIGFFDEYGKQLDNLKNARASKDIKAATDASTLLKRIGPEFGPAAVNEFIKAGVKDAPTAKNYLANIVDVKSILAGQPARQTPLIPRLDAARKSRIALYTGANKVFNIDKVGQKVVRALYGTEPQYADIATGLISSADQIAAQEKNVGKFKQPSGAIRMPLEQIQGRIDKFAAKFTAIPYFKNGFFDVASVDAPTQIYRIARLANSRYHSKMITEAFEAGNEGQRKQIFTGLWNTIAEIRGVSKSPAGLTYMDEFAGRGLEKKYASDIVVDGVSKGNPAQFGEQQLALFPYQLSSGIAVPSIVDLDRLSVRSGLIGKLMGLSHKKWVDNTLSLWVVGTLAGPRFAIRNATEDLMMHLAIGDSAWGVAKGRMLSTRLRLSKGITGGDKIGTALKKTVTLDTEVGELGVFNKLVRRKDLAKYQAKLAEAQTPQDVRELMAQAVASEGLAAKLDQESADILADLIKHGDIDNILADISEGGKNGLRHSDQYLNATADVAKFGKMGELEIDGIKYKQAVGDKSYTQFNPIANKQSRISWLVQLGISANDDLASIAIKYLDDEARALTEMRTYLKNLSPAQRERFQLYDPSVGGNINVHAKKAYDATRNLYSMRNGEINFDLLKKVRRYDDMGGVTVSSKNITLEDLPNSSIATPEFISGPTLVPVAASGNFAASLTDRAWDAMGEANARFSREPIVINEMIRVAKEVKSSGLEETILKRMTAGLEGEELAKATFNAKREVTSIVEELAKTRILSFVDNPAVRSQLAMSARNFARFYRATEDFYRRLYRTVRYNPEAINRAALTYEGVTHSGFVQQDDNGDSYFFYPGLTPVYQTMTNVANAFGMPEAFQTPMPVEFSAKLKMITPSMNPDSLFPTFAGPVAAVPMKFVFQMVPALNSLESVFLGTYAQDQPMVNAIFPSHVNRFLATLSRDERNSQYASAMRKGATYLEATGHGVKPVWNPETQVFDPPSPAELIAFKDKLSASTVTVLALRFMFGFFAPASPSITLKSDMAKWARDNGEVNYKQTFNAMITKYGDLGRATEEWIKYYPDQMPYTVSESTDNVVPVVRAVAKTSAWIEKNGKVLKDYPLAAPFLMPGTGDFDFDAYRLLFKSGIKYSKTIDDYLKDVSVARDEQFYYSQKDLYEEELASTYGDGAKSALKDQWDAWSKQYKNARPLLQEDMAQGGDRQRLRQRSYQDLQNMLNDKNVTVEPSIRKVLKDMSSAYDNYIYSRDLVVGSGATANNYKDLLKQNIKATLEELATQNSNAQDAYDLLFAKLIGE
jgi:hypothetical protein